MNKKPFFIMSFDCEGKWGFADCLTARRRDIFTDKNIKNVYQKIIALLDKYELLATFAFSGAFSLSKSEYEDGFDLSGAPECQKQWLESFFIDQRNGVTDGWFGKDAFEIVRSANKHEIASHGFTHIPCSENTLNLSAAKFELENIKKIAAIKNIEFKTFIYPRNVIGYIELLKKYNFIGYRGRISMSEGLFLKLCNIAREFNVLQKSQSTSSNKKELVVIPAGYMLTWRSGVKKHIPNYVVKRRWRSITLDAIKNNGVVHLWSHPCNFIDGNNQFELFEEVLKIICHYVKSGDVLNVTQEQYCNLLI